MGLSWHWLLPAGGGWAAKGAQLLQEGDEKWGRLHQLSSLVKIISQTTAGKWAGRRRKNSCQGRPSLGMGEDGELGEMPL